MNRINKPGSKRAFFRRKLELPILSRSGNIKFQVAWSEKLKMWQNVAKSGDASRRKGQNSRLGLTAKVFPQWAWKLSSSLYRPQFYSKLENFPSHFPRIFHGLLPKRMRAKNGLGCFWNRGLSCLDRIKLSDHEIKLKGMPSNHLWSHLARRKTLGTKTTKLWNYAIRKWSKKSLGSVLRREGSPSFLKTVLIFYKRDKLDIQKIFHKFS